MQKEWGVVTLTDTALGLGPLRVDHGACLEGEMKDWEFDCDGNECVVNKE